MFMVASAAPTASPKTIRTGIACQRFRVCGTTIRTPITVGSANRSTAAEGPAHRQAGQHRADAGQHGTTASRIDSVPSSRCSCFWITDTLETSSEKAKPCTPKKTKVAVRFCRRSNCVPSSGCHAPLVVRREVTGR